MSLPPRRRTAPAGRRRGALALLGLTFALLAGLASCGGVGSLAAGPGADLSARTRLRVARSPHGEGFHLDEGRGAIVVFAMLVVGIVSFQALIRMGYEARSRRKRRVPLSPAAAAAAARAAGATTGKEAAETLARAKSEQATVRCQRCYGKYDPHVEPSCPFCAEEDARRSMGGAPPTAAQVKAKMNEQARARTTNLSVGGPSRVAEAERLNEEGLKLLKTIAPVFRVDDAIKKFSRAIQRAPRNPSFHANRGVAHLTNARRRFAAVGQQDDQLLQRDVGLARKDLEEAIRLQDSEPSYHLWVGQLEEFAGRPGEADAAYRQVLHIDPAHAAALESVARLEAEAERTGSSHVRERAERLLSEASKRQLTGELENALALIDEAIDADPSFGPALFSKADILNRLNRVDESLLVAQQAISVSNQELQGLLQNYQAKGIGVEALEQMSGAADGRAGGGAAVGGDSGAVSGKLSEFSLPDLLQVLGSGQKTARATIRRGEDVAFIDLEDGWIVHARLGEVEGEEAFYELVTWIEGDFRVDPKAEIETRTIQGSNDALILEGLRRIDEARRDEYDEDEEESDFDDFEDFQL